MSKGKWKPFNQDVADQICELVSEGYTIAECAQIKGIPSRAVIFKWLNENKKFKDEYDRAREARADYHADELIKIADECEDPNKARLQVETRKWVASKLKPKTYGDKLAHGSDPENPLKVKHEHDVSPALQEVIGILSGIASRETEE